MNEEASKLLVSDNYRNISYLRAIKAIGDSRNFTRLQKKDDLLTRKGEKHPKFRSKNAFLIFCISVSSSLQLYKNYIFFL